LKPKSGKVVLTIWGARGSIPSPGSKTAHYGGNTSCIELRLGKELLILDAGTGIRELGMKLIKEGKISASILLTHYHWDHIMGLPFFGPGYSPHNHFRIYGENKAGTSLRSILYGQMSAPYFPVRLDEMMSQMEFIEIGPHQNFNIGEVQVSTYPARHPDSCVSYRISYEGRVITYATDTEHTQEIDHHLLKSARDADILIYDSAYTESEYPQKVGWGHSTWAEGIKLARAAKVKRLILWHHEPSHTDLIVRKIEQEARQHFRNCQAAYEGMKITL
jgi:phosphoribosyl 1,2-cyclic phosphodiesterase